MSCSAPKIRVCHLASGDLWAGAEVMVSVMAATLATRPECEIRAIVLNSGRLRDQLTSLGIPVRVLPESQFGPVKLFRVITKELREAGCNILHTHRYKENVLGGLAAACAGVPVCVRTVHGSPEPFRGLARARMALYLWLDRIVQRHLNDRVITVADYLKSELKSWLPEEKLVVIHNGLPKPIGELRREKENQDGMVVGWVGRMVDAKSLDVLLHAVARLRAFVPNITVRLAGDGPDSKRLENLSTSLGLRNVVEFCGFVPDLKHFLCTLDVFVLPSRQEGLPVSLLEAMQLEVPVIASAVGGIPELVKDGQSGILVPPGDSEALSVALQKIATDPVLRSRLQTGAKAVLHSQFTSEHLGSQLLTLYTDLLRKKKQFLPLTTASLS